MPTTFPARCDARPVFWQRQPRLPLPVMRFLRSRLAAALSNPQRRSLLVWPTLLGAPGLAHEYPDGIPLPALMRKATGLLAPAGLLDPEACWASDLASFPDTAEQDGAGWRPHASWAAMGSLVSLRSGVTLLALLGDPAQAGFQLRAAAALFNSALYHECHDVLDPLWEASRGHTKAGFQGLLLLAAGFHHQQLHNLAGMSGLWEDACSLLAPRSGELATPWGTLDYSAAVEAASIRLAWLADRPREADLAPVWDLPCPTWEVL